MQYRRKTMNRLMLILSLVFVIAVPTYSWGAVVCTKDLDGNGVIDQATEKWACDTSVSPALCPRDAAVCVSRPYEASGTAGINPTAIAGKNGFSRFSTGQGGHAIDISGWSVSNGVPVESQAGSIYFTVGTVSGTVSGDKITKISGDGDKLVFSGCSGRGCSEGTLGHLSVNGATFTGTVSADSGFISVSASGTGLTFTGRTCDKDGCSIINAGTITISGVKYVCPYGDQFPCVLSGGNYRCSQNLCHEGDQKVCAKDLNGNGQIEHPTEISICAPVAGGYFCPIGAVNCGTGGTGDSEATCPADVTGCPGGTYNTALNKCETALAVTSYTCPKTGGSYSTLDACKDACIGTGTCSQVPVAQQGPYYCTTYFGRYTGYHSPCEGCTNTYTDAFQCDRACPSTLSPPATTMGNTCPAGVPLSLWGYYIYSYINDAGMGGTWTEGFWYYVYSYYTSYVWSCSLTGMQYGDADTCNSNCGQSTACTPVTGCPPGYSRVNDTCVADPSGAYTGDLNTTTDQCETVAAVMCTGGLGYDSDRDSCVAPAACPGGGKLDASANKCTYAVDSSRCPEGSSWNNDYDACLMTGECPDGGTLNPVANMCELSVSLVCAEGYVFDVATNTCRAAASCLVGSLNEVLGKCFLLISELCPEGYTWSDTSGKCVRDPDCPPGSSYSGSEGLCTAPGYTDCPAGGTYDETAGVCKADVNIQCADSTTYDWTLRLCQGNATCVAGGTLNGSKDRCELAQTPSCPAGYSYVSARNRCEVNPSCPSGGVYNSTTNKCESSVIPTCSSGYYYVSGRNQCEKAPDCPAGGGVYNSSYNRCEYWLSITCPSGYYWNGSICVASVACPSGGSYNTTYNWCEQAATSSFTCTLTGYYYSTPAACSAACTRIGTCTQVQVQGGPYYCTTYYTTYTGYHSPCEGCTNTYTYGSPICDRACPSTLSPPRRTRGNTCPGGVPLSLWGYYLYGYIIDAGMAGIYTSTDWYYVYSYYTTNYVWSCSLTGTQYGSSAACTSACTQTGSCTGPTYSCPSGWSRSGSTCYKSAACPSGGSLNGTTDRCEASPSSSCAAGYTYDSGRSVCYAAAGCSGGGTLNGSIDMCIMAYTPTCSPGYSWNGSTCTASATCPSGGSLDGTVDKCQVAYTPTCPSGYTYESTNNLCWTNPQCSVGTYDAIYDRCHSDPVIACPPGYAYYFSGNKCEAEMFHACDLAGFNYNSVIGLCAKVPDCSSGGGVNVTTSKCEVSLTASSCPASFTYLEMYNSCVADPDCPAGGIYDPALRTCIQNIFDDCPEGYTFNGSNGLCQRPPDCPAGSFDSSAGKCIVTGASLCPADYTYNPASDRCERDPLCSTGSLFQDSTGLCEAEAVHNCPASYIYSSSSDICTSTPVCATGNYDPLTDRCGGAPGCPYGAQYPCLPNPTTGILQCSNNTCTDMSSIAFDTSNADLSSLQNDGTVDPNSGECSGSFYIFNGRGQECKRPGISTTFFNCCDTKVGSFGPIKEVCGDGDVQTVQAVSAGRCHYIGDYCKKKWPFVGCVQSASVYCCFGSKLGRIVQEQGRPQLQGNLSWGNAKGPNCRGFTAEEFQFLDFTKIDLTEYIGHVKAQTQSIIQQKLQNDVTNFFQATQQ